MNEMKYTWNLEKMYKTLELWEKEYAKVKKEIEILKKSDHNFLKSSKSLLQAFIDYDNLERKLYSVYLYAKMQSDANGLDNDASKRLMAVKKINEEFETATSFYSIELKKLNHNLLKKYYLEEPKLKEYNYMLKKIIKDNKHTLSLKEEELLAKSSTIREGYEDIFTQIDAIDVKFPKVFGKELNHSTYSVFLKNKNQKVRQKAWSLYHNYYKEHANTLANCLINSIKNDCFVSKIRKYNSPLEMALSSDNINIKVYQKLINSIHNTLPLLQQYLRLKTKANNLKKLHIYDLSLASSNYDKKFSFEEAKEIACNSVKILGTEYTKIYKSAFEDRWIDVYYRKGKYSGAYSSGCYDSYPYICMNYNDSFRAIETLCHEMGHSMHSYYARNNNPYNTSNYPIFLAEIASNVNELLLFDYMLNNTNDKELKKYILENILESFRGSIFRQTQFAEYEQILHEKINNDENLGTEDVVNIYYDLNRLYYGKDIICDDLVRYESLRIPHYYFAFYVYKYATGLAIAYVFASRILNGEENAVENYLKFLKIGGTDYPLEVLKQCKVDFSEKIIDEAMNKFNDYLIQYEKLIEGVEKNGN